jgi:hypothetical protein
VRYFSPVGPIQVNVGYNPFSRTSGALYYIPPANKAGFSPLYCVSPGNGIPAPIGASEEHEQLSDRACPTSFTPAQNNTFFSHLKLSFSIGPDF